MLSPKETELLTRAQELGERKLAISVAEQNCTTQEHRTLLRDERKKINEQLSEVIHEAELLRMQQKLNIGESAA